MPMAFRLTVTACGRKTKSYVVSSTASTCVTFLRLSFRHFFLVALIKVHQINKAIDGRGWLVDMAEKGVAGESISSRLRRKRETFYDDKECELSETKRRRECHNDVRISIMPFLATPGIPLHVYHRMMKMVVQALADKRLGHL